MLAVKKNTVVKSPVFNKLQLGIDKI